MTRLGLFAVTLATGLSLQSLAIAQVPEFARVPPTEPDRAEATFRTLHGFRMELIAAEPLVADPVDLAYDENGRAYVVEFRGYPRPELPDDPPPEPIGRVRLLEDQDDDGCFDDSHVFADGLQWPTSVVLWKRGVFVAAPPDIWYFEDTDGDKTADVRRKVFTGFGNANVQAVMNNLRWGLDHWIYGAAGSNGGDVVPADRPQARAVSLRRRDFRFDPTTGVLEATSGGQRFGNAFDDWGNRFLCNIRNPVQHVVMPSRYLDRNPHLLTSAAVHDVAESGDRISVYRISPPEPWRVFRAQRWALERVNYPQSELVGAGYFTSSSGVTIYRGAAYPPAFQGNAFVADVAANIVHRQILEADGVTFRSRRADEGAEFVASIDPWFRPVNFVNAPDGTLTVLDMYRETIEHPWSIPDDIRSKLDLSSGNDRGRLYRLAPPGFEPPKSPRLNGASTDVLVRKLENPNAWWRETAHRLIHERQDRNAIPPLRELLFKSAVPQARLHALWSLEGLNALSHDDLSKALRDSQPQIREHAVAIAETRMTQSDVLRHAVLERCHDEDARVRMQVAFSLGEAFDELSAKGLAVIARRDAGNEFLRTAVLSSVSDSPLLLLKELLHKPTFDDRVGGTALVGQLATFAAFRSDGEATEAIALAQQSGESANDLHYAIIGGVADGLARRRRQLADLPAAAAALTELLQHAAAAASENATPLSERLRAIDLLRHAEFELAAGVFSELLRPEQPRDVHLAAVRMIGSFANDSAAETLVGELRRMTRPVQAEAIETLVRRPQWAGSLLAAIEAGKVQASLVPVARRNLLLSHKEQAVRDSAAKIFGADPAGSRSDVIARYSAALKARGERESGRAIFRRECSSCHRLFGIGEDVGPALTTVRHRSPEELLVHILDPNREVTPESIDHTVVLKDGRVLAGLLVAESDAGLTLRRAQGIDESIARSEIEEISNTGRSLMPEGLERNITPREMADLIAFLLDSSEDASTKEIAR